MSSQLKPYLCHPFFRAMDERRYTVRLGGLTVGTHRYEFEVDDQFFEGRDYSEITGANVRVVLDLIKHNNLLTLHFNIEGKVQVACDRCTKPYPVNIHSSEELHVRFGDPDEDHPENVLVVHPGENELDISQPLYEFISLAVPVRKVPCEKNKAFKCDEETLKKLNQVSTDNPGKETESVWDKLKNISNN